MSNRSIRLMNPSFDSGCNDGAGTVPMVVNEFSDVLLCLLSLATFSPQTKTHTRYSLPLPIA